MNSLAIEVEIPKVENLIVTDETLSVELSDGRTISVPLAWYPRLLNATEKEKKKWKLIGRGVGIHWKDIDEDISIKALLLGRASGESQQSLKKWLKKRKNLK